jgi:hypothetical protein
MKPAIYIRAPAALKQALKDYAAERETSENAAAVSLLELALEAIADQTTAEQLKRGLEAATSELETTRAALHEAGLQHRAAAEVYKTVARRARQPLAKCLACREPLYAADLFVTGHCPHPGCGAGVTRLLATTTPPGFSEADYLAFLGALGGLAGLALDTPSQTPSD